MQRINYLVFIFLLGCATERGKIGSILIKSPNKNDKDQVTLYKDKRYIVWAQGCGLSNQFSSVTDFMVNYYNGANPEKEKAYGMADIQYEHSISFIIPCLRMKGTPLIKTKRREVDFIPVELNYL